MKQYFENGRWVYWVAGGGLVTLGVVVWVNQRNTQKVYDQIKAKLDDTDNNLQTGGATGGAEDLGEWLPLAAPAKFLSTYKGAAATISIGGPKARGKAWEYAQRIYDSKKMTGDNEQRVVDTFKLLKNKADVAKLADAFRLRYSGADLLGFLKSFMDNSPVGRNYMNDLYSVITKLD